MKKSRGNVFLEDKLKWKGTHKRNLIRICEKTKLIIKVDRFPTNTMLDAMTHVSNFYWKVIFPAVTYGILAA